MKYILPVLALIFGALVLIPVGAPPAQADDERVTVWVPDVFWLHFGGCWHEGPHPHPGVVTVSCHGAETFCMVSYRAKASDGPVGSNVWWRCGGDVVVEVYPDDADGQEDGHHTICIMYPPSALDRYATPENARPDHRFAEALAGR